MTDEPIKWPIQLTSLDDLGMPIRYMTRDEMRKLYPDPKEEGEPEDPPSP